MLLNTEIKHSIPGNPPSLGALQGTLHNTEVSASLPPGGTHTHSVHSEPAGARPLRAAHMPRSTLSRVAILLASGFPPRPASSWPGSEPRPTSSGCCLFSILSWWRSFHWDRSSVKWGQLQRMLPNRPGHVPPQANQSPSNMCKCKERYFGFRPNAK